MAEREQNQRVVYSNGVFIPESRAGVGIYDAALTTGQKVVEVSRTFNHHPFKLDEHLLRLYKGLEMLSIDPRMSIDDMGEISRETLARNLTSQPEHVDWQMIHYVSSGPAAVFDMHEAEDIEPTVLIHCIPLVNRIGKRAQKYIEGTDLVVVEQRALPQDIVPGQIKSNGRLDHMMARLQAGAMMPGATGVLLDQDGNVTEATGASLFIVEGERIKTAPSDRVLTGITREMVFDLAATAGIEIEESDFGVATAEQASEMFITSTVICQDHVRSFNGKRLSNNGAIGQITSVIRDAMVQELGLDFVQQALDYQRMLREHGRIR